MRQGTFALFLLVVSAPFTSYGQTADEGNGGAEAAPTNANPTDATVVSAARGPAPAGGDWRFDFHGFLRAPMRIGMAKRDNAGPGQSRINFHEPRVPDDQYLSWLYTRNQERAWAEAFFSYGNGTVTGNLGIQAYNFTDATWNDQDAQLGISQGWVAWQPDLGLPGARLLWKVGSFWNKYGGAGKYDAGQYDTYAFGRTHAMGETVRGEYDVSDVTIGVEHGLGAKPSHPELSPRDGFTLLHHAHVDADYQKKVKVGAHYLTAWTQDADATPTSPDGQMTVAGLEARINGGLLGDLYLAYSNIKASHATSVGPAIEVLHSLGGQYFGLGITENYLGANSGGNGHIGTLLFQYDFSFGLLYRNLRRWGTEFYGDGPDCTVSLFGMYSAVSSDDAVFDGTKKFKYGGEVIYTPIAWFGAGARADRVMPNSKDTTQSFSVLSPKILFRSKFITHEQFTLLYSKYFYGQNPPAPSGPILPYGYGAPGITGRPDENVFKVQATIWW
jgi:hypothetical protein